jgi:arylformamidase
MIRLGALLTSTALMCLTGMAEEQSKKERKEQEERPSQAAVLAKDSVVQLNRAYGSDVKQTLDIYSPRGAKEAPVVIFVHGGEWTKGDKADVSYKPKFLNENGIVLVSINYRLSPAVMHPAHANDVAASVAWMRDHAAEIGADRSKIVLMGHSAGCHLATLTALDPRYLAKMKRKPTDLRGVVAWSGGMYDLADRVKGEGMYPKYIRQAFGESDAAWRDASPMTHVGKSAMPPFVFVSIEKGSASHKAAERMVELIRKAKGEAESNLVTGRTHFMANHLLGAPDDTTGQILLEFVKKVTR